MKVIVKRPQQPFEIVEVEDFEKFYPKIISHVIPEFTRITKDVQMIFRDDYLSVHSIPNLKYRHPEIDHIACGPVVFAGINEGGETLGFNNPEQVKMHLEILFHSFTKEESKKVNPEDYYEVHVFGF